MSILESLGTVLCGVFFAEFSGYWVHRLLHSHKIESFSRNHMIHHLRVYGPKSNQQTEQFLSAVEERPSFGNIGTEWIFPIAGVSLIFVIPATFAGVPWTQQALFLASAYTWSWVFFSYLHDAMHVKNHWMQRLPVVGPWFLRARKLHVIHHLEFKNNGLIEKNFGISFFWFDRLMGTFAPRASKFNDAGYTTAKKLYSFVFSS